ncbi:MAG: PEP-CTERM sorting domain-containing protein [Paucibacter sp.]|nr:PEP-CTERM sorting domain-containing protein [Roseateles sp.]
MKPAPSHTARTWLAAAALSTLPAAALAASGYVTTNEAKLDTIYSQAGFGANPIDIRFNTATSIINVALTVIDNGAEWATLTGLAGNLASPTVNMYFVDKILWCGAPTLTTIGCAQQPGNVLALDSAWAADATYGGNLAGHELGHNLNLPHLMPDNAANLMNPTISASFALSAGQITTILASALVQTDAKAKYITVQPIAVLVPEPAAWALMLGGVLLLGLARRRGTSVG